MSDNINLLLVGCGYMAGEYYKVLKGLDICPVVVGRSSEKCKEFSDKYDIPVISGGVENSFEEFDTLPEYAIVSVSIEELCNSTMSLLDKGIKNILIEKPAGMNTKEIQDLSKKAIEKDAKVFVAYNRRFYQSTEKAIDIIKMDGGVKSFHFEFTEWESDILASIKSDKVKESILLANSSHVIDLAFFLGGLPIEMSSYVTGELDWHHNGCVYAGAGKTSDNVLFSYNANWGAPGRWSVEIMTSKHRLYFKPMEKLAIQEINSVQVNQVDMDYSIDEEYKPGLFNQVKSFIYNPEDTRLLNIEEQLEHMSIYEKIAGIQ